MEPSSVTALPDHASGHDAANAAFAAFYQREFGRTVAAVHRHVGADAEDVAQEAFIAAARRWPEVSELDVPAAWVRHVARRIGVRRVTRERQRAAIEEAVALTEPYRERDADLADALTGLPDRHAAAIRLHHLEDRPVADVAERLGCSAGAAKVLLLRARSLLAERLTGLTGRWVSEKEWPRDAIVAYLGSIGARQHVEPILEQDLRGRGGRWELTVIDGAYTLYRDDGMRLDHGVGRMTTGRLELRPTLNTGRAAYRPIVDGQRLHLRLIDTTIPGTLGVPDETWVSLYMESGAFIRTGSNRGSL